ncbi:MAG TPA: hypothetical protein VGO40_03250 [Longimicrobium sp.]|nr:hypothetical protein [Longimicrobium sp.]
MSADTALAAVIFGRWDPVRAGIACLFFAAAETLQIQLQSLQAIPSQFVSMIPYVPHDRGARRAGRPLRAARSLGAGGGLIDRN